MQNQPIQVKLHLTITGKDPSDPADTILQKIQQIRQSVAQLRDESHNLERIRDQFIIHLQQCQEDHNILRQINKKLKLKLDLATQDVLNVQAEIGQTGQIGQQVATGVAYPTSDVKPVVARRMPTLENLKITPEVVCHDKYPASSVRLRYALNIQQTVICTVQFSPDGSKIAFSDGNFVFIVSSADGEIVSTIELHSRQVEDVAHTRVLKWSPNGQFLALSGQQNEVLYYNVETGQLVHSFEGHQKSVSAIVFKADGSWLITGGFDGVITVWDTNTYQRLKSLPHEEQGTGDDTKRTIVGIATTPEADLYAVGFMKGSLGIHDGNFDQPMVSFVAHRDVIMGLAISPYDNSIATVSHDRTVKVWQVKGVATCKHTLEGHTDIVLSVAFSPKSELMITGSKDQTIRMWKHKAGKPLFTITAHTNTVFEIDHHPTQRSFVTCAGDGVVCVWDYDELN